LSLGYITLVTPIKGDSDRASLQDHLRANVAPDSISGCNIRCRRTFRFDKVESLHFCSMLILNGVNKDDEACFVFEATFDGSKEDFLDDLLRAEARGIDSIYKHCVDYPQPLASMPELVKEYLLSCDVGANTFYSGSPGRSVAQIKGEQRIRDQIVSFIQKHRPTATLPTTFRGLQCELQQDVIRKETKNRWAEQRAEVPWEVSQSSIIGRFVALLGIIAACIIGAITLKLNGYSFDALYQLFREWSLNTFLPAEFAEYFGLSGPFNFLQNFMSPVAGIADRLRLPYHPVLISLISIWFALRFWEFLLFQTFKDPRSHGFTKSSLANVLSILRLALIIFIAAFGVLLLDTERQSPTLWISVLEVIILFAIWVCLWYWEKTLELRTQFRKLKASNETVRSFLLDILRLFKFLFFVLMVFIISRHLPAGEEILKILKRLAPYALVLGLYFFTGAFLAYAALFILFWLIRLLELWDRRRFAPASELINKFDTPSVVYQREEGGVNKIQNHLASLTYVKPGIVRGILLRLSLFAVGLLARYKFNRGTLGDIPTIIAARWVIIRGGEGERLLFLSNYVGALDSYLNEFIDLAAVRGLNAIWTNTFVNFRSNASTAAVNPVNSKRGYAFPETEFYLWRGAEEEKSFKAYVRQSQVETIVWYSAYPTLTTVNINANTDLRQALFEPLASSELDTVFLKAGL
jgi:hypothetical protein